MGSLNQSLGHLTSYTQHPNGITIHTPLDVVQVTIFNSHVVRVHIVPNGHTGRDFSYALVAQPENVPFSIDEQPDSLTLATDAMKLVIDKQPVRFSLQTLDGKTINADDKAFGSSRLGTEVTTYKQLQTGERFLGLGEKTGNLDRKGSAYTNWNTDKFAYGVDADPIYMSIPFYIGVHSGLCYGIFFDNSHQSQFNFGASNNRFASFGAADGEMDYYLIYADNIRQIIQHYSWLTGRMELPPMWSLGFQQCRYSYYPDKEVLNLASTFREKTIPADVVYLDIHYMDEYKVFTFHPERFPKPAEMVKRLKEMDFHTVVIVDPGIKVQKGYAPYEEGLAQQLFATYPDGEPYSGEVWPSWSHFPDFTNPKTRNWWGEKLSFYTDKGIDGFWNDMNEPASWGQCTPDLVQFDYDGDTASHKKAHNVYGMQMARSTQQGAKKLLNNRRPFVLNRAGYAGVQRFAASWTGDNVASDEHMLCGVRLLNSLGLSGVAFTGYDIGGFAGDSNADLFAKWIATGAFTPMMRCHSMINSKDSEPWAYGEETEEISRNYIGLRYRLLPYLYSTFFESTQNGMPVVRSLAIDHPFDDTIYSPTYQNQYSFGDAILVAPSASGKDLLKVYLPQGTWYDLHNGKKLNSGEHIAEVRNERFPLFVKGSAIIPMQSLVQSTKEQPKDVLELHVYFGERENSFVYYEDDGETYNYQQEAYYQRSVSFLPHNHSLSIGKVQGSLKSKFATIQLYLHGFDANPTPTVNGQSAATALVDYQYIQPVSNFDPFYKADVQDMMEHGVLTFQFKNQTDEIVIQW